MSGGVDSSVVAALMKDQGYNVTGITLKLYDDAKTSSEGRQCCAGQDIIDAKRVSEKINIDHKILYYQKKFKTEVVDSFIDSYVSGETPIPWFSVIRLLNLEIYLDMLKILMQML